MYLYVRVNNRILNYIEPFVHCRLLLLYILYVLFILRLYWILRYFIIIRRRPGSKLVTHNENYSCLFVTQKKKKTHLNASNVVNVITGMHCLSNIHFLSFALVLYWILFLARRWTRIDCCFSLVRIYVLPSATCPPPPAHHPPPPTGIRFPFGTFVSDTCGVQTTRQRRTTDGKRERIKTKPVINVFCTEIRHNGVRKGILDVHLLVLFYAWAFERRSTAADTRVRVAIQTERGPSSLALSDRVYTGVECGEMDSEIEPYTVVLPPPPPPPHRDPGDAKIDNGRIVGTAFRSNNRFSGLQAFRWSPMTLDARKNLFFVV